MGILVALASVCIIVVAVYYLVGLIPAEWSVFGKVIQIIVFAGAALYILGMVAEFFLGVSMPKLR